MITRCIACRNDAIVKDRVYIDPLSGDDPTPMWHRGWICEDCAIVNWAWEFDPETCPPDIGGVSKVEVEED